MTHHFLRAGVHQAHGVMKLHWEENGSLTGADVIGVIGLEHDFPFDSLKVMICVSSSNTRGAPETDQNRASDTRPDVRQDALCTHFPSSWSDVASNPADV